MIEDHWFRSGGAHLRGTSGGSGAGMVLLHAGVADRRMWRETQAHFCREYSVLSYDRRGFGETRSSDEMFRHVDDLQAVLGNEGDRQQIVVGCSQGGRIAIDYALVHPERVAALVLVSTAVTGAASPDAYPPSIAAIFSALEEAEESHDIERVNVIEARIWLDGPLGQEGRVTGAVRELFLDMNRIALDHPGLTKEMPYPNAWERLNVIAAPTLLLCGELDFPHIQERSRVIAGEIPHAQFAILPGCAHLPSLEQPDQFNQVLGSFLAQIS
jgi:pimeloyl-ACP methyl ester carboxylesterase